MEQQDASRRKQKKSIGGDLVIPILAVAFTLYYLSTILEAPWEAQVNAFFVGTLLVVLCGVFLLRSLLAVRRGAADLRVGALFEPLSLVPRRLVLFGLALGYIVVLPWGGFTLTTFVFLLGGMLLLGAWRRKGFKVLLAAGLALVGYLVFIVAFETRFEPGPFERLMGQLL